MLEREESLIVMIFFGWSFACAFGLSFNFILIDGRNGMLTRACNSFVNGEVVLKDDTGY